MVNLSQPDPSKLILFPAVVADPDSGVFEIALVLGGTVSAGAHTAGALDVLIQALDRFYAGNAGQPPHQIKLPSGRRRIRVQVGARLVQDWV